MFPSFSLPTALHLSAHGHKQPIQPQQQQTELADQRWRSCCLVEPTYVDVVLQYPALNARIRLGEFITVVVFETVLFLHKCILVTS